MHACMQHSQKLHPLSSEDSPSTLLLNKQQEVLGDNCFRLMVPFDFDPLISRGISLSSSEQ